MHGLAADLHKGRGILLSCKTYNPCPLEGGDLDLRISLVWWQQPLEVAGPSLITITPTYGFERIKFVHGSNWQTKMSCVTKLCLECGWSRMDWYPTIISEAIFSRSFQTFKFQNLRRTLTTVKYVVGVICYNVLSVVTHTSSTSLT